MKKDTGVEQIIRKFYEILSLPQTKTFLDPQDLKPVDQKKKIWDLYCFHLSLSIFLIL